MKHPDENAPNYWYERGKYDAYTFIPGFSSAPWPLKPNATQEQKDYFRGFHDYRNEQMMKECSDPELIEQIRSLIDHNK